MARAKSYSYKMNDVDGKVPKKGLITIENGVAVYSRLLRINEINRYDLVDLNTNVKKLTKYRSSIGMKQEELAEITGISVKTIQGWEVKGMNKAALDSALKVADVLRCNVRDLLEDE